MCVRRSSHRVEEQACVSDGLLHRGQEQHEGDSLSLCSHVPPVPVLLSAPQTAAVRRGCAAGPAAAAGTQTPAPLQTGLGAESGSQTLALQPAHPAGTLVRQ